MKAYLLLFAVMESVQEFLSFSLFELVFGNSVHGPLTLLKENWLSENIKSLTLLDCVPKFRIRLKKACELVKQDLKGKSLSNKPCLYQLEWDQIKVI